MLKFRMMAMLATVVALAATGAHAQDQPNAPQKPTLYLIGDSTVQVGTKGQQGWGTPLPAYFDTTKINIVNRARGGRSSRTFFTEGLWDAVVKDLKPGDFVLMQFGHNDGGPLFGERARASLKGTGEETQEGTHPDGKKETVHTYGWYLRRYVRDAKEKGALPIVLSPIPRNRWTDGKVDRAAGWHGGWAREVAQGEDVPFVDLNEITARQYEALGKEKVDTLFGGDWTHTNPAGADLNAASVVSGLKGLKECALCRFLSDKAAPLVPYTPAEPAKAN